MKYFLDTSTLVMRYVAEGDYLSLDKTMEQATSVYISPITRLEINSVLERKLRDKTLMKKDVSLIEEEFEMDLNYFGIIKWNLNLEQTAIKLIRKHQLKVFDGLQMASGIISEADFFITSDTKLFKSLQNEKVPSNFIKSS